MPPNPTEMVSGAQGIQRCRCVVAVKCDQESEYYLNSAESEIFVMRHRSWAQVVIIHLAIAASLAYLVLLWGVWVRLPGEPHQPYSLQALLSSGTPSVLLPDLMRKPLRQCHVHLLRCCIRTMRGRLQGTLWSPKNKIPFSLLNLLSI